MNDPAVSRFEQTISTVMPREGRRYVAARDNPWCIQNAFNEFNSRVRECTSWDVTRAAIYENRTFRKDAIARCRSSESPVAVQRGKSRKKRGNRKAERSSYRLQYYVFPPPLLPVMLVHESLLTADAGGTPRNAIR